MPGHYSAAVIGAGRMGAKTSEVMRRYAPPCWFPLNHLDALEAHDRVQVDAICDRDRHRLEGALAAHRTAAGYPDFASMLANHTPDLLTIATRTPGRCDMILGALERRISAIHVEKPLCNSVEELGRLERAFANDNVFVTYGALRRLFEVYRRARDVANSGRLGALAEFSIRFGTAALYWTHPHSVDLILFAAGPRRVVNVQAKLANVVTGERTNQITSDPIIENAAIFFDDGTIGHITRSPSASFAIAGIEGEVLVEGGGSELVVLAKQNDDPYFRRSVQIIERQAGPQGTYCAISQLVACLDGNARTISANSILKTDILLGQRILFAFVQSHLLGNGPVSIDELDPGLEIIALTNGNPA